MHYALCIMKNAFEPNRNQVYLYFLRRSILCEVNYFVSLQSQKTKNYGM